MIYFIGVLKRSLKIVITYKWHYIINLLLRPLFIFILISLFKTIYHYDGNRNILGYSCNQLIWYFVAVTFFYSMVWSEIDKELSQDIISGNMAVRLTKPISVFKTAFFNAISFKIIDFFFVFIPTFAIYAFFVFPDFLSFASLIKYLISSGFAFLLFYLMSFLIGISAFELQSITTLQSIKNTLVLLSGVYIPFEFLPEFIKKLIQLLPFQYIFYIPTQFFLNKPETVSLDYFLNTLFFQSVWIVIFLVLCRIFWRKAVKKFYSVGG